MSDRVSQSVSQSASQSVSGGREARERERKGKRVITKVWCHDAHLVHTLGILQVRKDSEHSLMHISEEPP